MKALQRAAGLAFVLWLCCGNTSARGADVTVFAASSLTDSLREIAQEYQKKSGDKIVLNLGASSTLARQIEEGAPADIFFSADEAKMDDLDQRGLILKETRRDRLANSLVLIVAKSDGAAVQSPRDLAKPEVRRVALGDPRAVPAGIYAREYLEALGLWSAVAPKVVGTENVRAALAAVESGDADASIVFKTDAMISKKVKVVFEVPLGEGPKISYPMAVLKESKAMDAARAFLGVLASEQAGRIFEKYGFRVTPGGAPGRDHES
jgi:molybdate transport system substrate-binding protein